MPALLATTASVLMLGILYIGAGSAMSTESFLQCVENSQKQYGFTDNTLRKLKLKSENKLSGILRRNRVNMPSSGSFSYNGSQSKLTAFAVAPNDGAGFQQKACDDIHKKLEAALDSMRDTFKGFTIKYGCAAERRSDNAYVLCSYDRTPY